VYTFLSVGRALPDLTSRELISLVYCINGLRYSVHPLAGGPRTSQPSGPGSFNILGKFENNFQNFFVFKGYPLEIKKRVLVASCHSFFIYFTLSEHSYNIYVYNSSRTASCFYLEINIQFSMPIVLAPKSKVVSRQFISSHPSFCQLGLRSFDHNGC
jgi:hypothetical protein